MRSGLGGWAEGWCPVVKEVRKGAHELKSHCGASAVLACESTLVTANLSLSIQCRYSGWRLADKSLWIGNGAQFAISLRFRLVSRQAREVHSRPE